MAQLRVERRDIFTLIPYANNARVHSPEQIEEIAASILEFGFNDPLSVDENNVLVTGHGTHEALKLLVTRGREDFREVDTVILAHMSERQKRAYILAHNRISQNSTWDFTKLSDELNALVESDFSIDIIGFDEQEIDGLLKIDPSVLPDSEQAVQPPPAEEPAEGKEKRTRAKSKILHTCPACKHEFTA
jgi:ParB-like chromosome segregation protein Spo0J